MLFWKPRSGQPGCNNHPYLWCQDPRIWRRKTCSTSNASYRRPVLTKSSKMMQLRMSRTGRSNPKPGNLTTHDSIMALHHRHPTKFGSIILTPHRPSSIHLPDTAIRTIMRRHILLNGACMEHLLLSTTVNNTHRHIITDNSIMDMGRSNVDTTLQCHRSPFRALLHLLMLLLLLPVVPFLPEQIRWRWPRSWIVSTISIGKRWTLAPVAAFRSSIPPPIAVGTFGLYSKTPNANHGTHPFPFQSRRTNSS
jgi:hypothetical protein